MVTGFVFEIKGIEDLALLGAFVQLRWRQNSFQHLDFDGSLLPLFITWCYIHGTNNCPNRKI